MAASSPQRASEPEPPAIEVVLASGGRVLIRGEARISTVRAVIAAMRG